MKEGKIKPHALVYIMTIGLILFASFKIIQTYTFQRYPVKVSPIVLTRDKLKNAISSKPEGYGLTFIYTAENGKEYRVYTNTKEDRLPENYIYYNKFFPKQYALEERLIPSNTWYYISVGIILFSIVMYIKERHILAKANKQKALK